MRLELEDLGVKVFVPARTPLLASMGRWVILSDGNKAIRNSAKKRENKDESTDRDEHRQTTSSEARSQHACLRIPRYVLVGDEERAMMEMPAANLVSSLAAYGVLQRHWGRPPQALSIRTGRPGAAQRSPATGSQIRPIGTQLSRNARNASRESYRACPMSVRFLLNNTLATCCAL